MKGDPQPFRVGVNYWPARTAMGFWTGFSASEVRLDFERLVAAGFDSARVFLTWEDFQPEADRVDIAMVRRLYTTLDLAQTCGLSVMPTLFTGHMSGINLLPEWALGSAGGNQRFRVVAGGKVSQRSATNWYTDPGIFEAQARLARELAGAVGGHPALWAWDLGNENSNCVVPPTRVLALDWLRRISDAVRGAGPAQRITAGLHMEDLEQDRKLGPAEAAEVCDFLTMHGYPGYAPWSNGPTDDHLLPFLASVTRWLSGGKEVLFSEFGVPTFRDDYGEAESVRRAGTTLLLEERGAAAYVGRSLEALHAGGALGAMLWCNADYVAELWRQPPFDEAIHERFFGQWRADGSAKPAVAVVQRFAATRPLVVPGPAEALEDPPWIDIDPSEYWRTPGEHLPRLYRRSQNLAAATLRSG